MPTKKKASGRKRDHEADLAELEELRKQIAQRDKAEKARKAEEARKEEEAARKKEEAVRKEEESQVKRQVSSRRQRTLVRWDGMWSFIFLFPFYSQSCFIFSFRELWGCQIPQYPGISMDRRTVAIPTCIHVENLSLDYADN